VVRGYEPVRRKDEGGVQVTAWEIHVQTYKREIVIIPAEQIEPDPGINRPVLVSANLAGSEPDWKIETVEE